MAFNRRYSNNMTSRNRLSDRDMMVDLINTEKHLSHLYEHAIMESNSNNIHTTLEELQHDEHKNAYTLFNAMQERGWYNFAGQEQRQNSKKMITMKKTNSRYYNSGGNRGKSYNNQNQYT